MAEVEKELLNGQSAQGPLTAEEVYLMTDKTGVQDRLASTSFVHIDLFRFPLFTAVHKICIREMEPSDLINHLRSHPEHNK